MPSDVVKRAEQANSNQEVVNMYQNYSSNNAGNSQIHNTQWQRRKQSGLNDMINELISESAASDTREDIFGETPFHAPDIIEVSVSQNKLALDLVDSSKLKDASIGSSSESKKKMIKFKKRQNQRVVPHPPMSNSSDESSEDDEMMMLPDVNMTHI